MQVSCGVSDGGMDGREVKNPIGARGGAPSFLLRPTVPRCDQSQVKQAAVGHRSGAGTDIIGQLRAHQDDRRAVADGVKIGASIPAGHGARAVIR
jgi:hypothetical protein